MVKLLVATLLFALALPASNAAASCSVLAYVVPDGLRLLNVDSSAAQTIPLSIDGQSPRPGLYWSPDGSQVVFQTYKDIYVLDNQTRSVRELAEKPLASTFAWSPDGQQLAYSILGKGIQVFDFGNGQTQSLTPNFPDASYANWSPDGQHMTFISYGHFYGAEATYLLYLSDLRTEFLGWAMDYHFRPVWSPDSTKLAFHAVETIYRSNQLMIDEATDALYVLKLKSDAWADISLMPESGTYAPLQWMPDSTSFLFDSLKGEIIQVETDGTAHNLTNNSAWDGFAVLSPDATQIAFASNRDGDTGIYVMDTSGANVRRLDGVKSGVVNDMAWSPDGKWMFVDFGVLSGADEESPDHIINISEAKSQNLLDDTGVPYHLSAAWIPHPGACSALAAIPS